jgi:hypothetical protein
MFVDEVVRLPAPPAVAWDRLSALMRVDTGWQDAATDAFDQGRQLLLLAGVVGATERVIVQSLPAYLRGDTTVVPFRWVTEGPVGDLYPAVDANLELGPAVDGGSRLQFTGSYRPLPDHLDLTLDEVVLRGAARATALGLLGRVTRAILSPDDGSK